MLHGRTYEWTGGPLWPPWWLIAKDGTDRVEVFTLDGGDLLPIFSGEDEVEMYLWFNRACEDGWEARRSSSAELMSVLYGPCSSAGAVVLDPSPEIMHGRPRLTSLGRRRFVEWMSSERTSLDEGALSGAAREEQMRRE